MGVSSVSTVLVIIFGFLMNYERWITCVGLWQALMCGTITGLICGDLQTGLYIGGTLQLMTLGISSFGGASVPDYPVAAIVGTYLAITTGASPEVGVTIGVPVAIIMVQLDVLNKTLNIFFQHGAEKDVAKGDFHRIPMWQWLGNIFTMVSTGVPIMLAVLFGQGLVEKVFEIIPEWLLTGLQVVSGLLPVVGIGLLLRTMPVKQNVAPLIVGFVFASYLGMPILGIALLAMAWAFVSFKNSQKTAVSTAAVPTDGGIEGDE